MCSKVASMRIASGNPQLLLVKIVKVTGGVEGRDISQ